MTRPQAIIPITQDKKFIRMIVYGDPGCGKTVLAGTSPKCLILDADDGSESAAVQGATGDKWVVNTWEDLEGADEYLRHEGHKDFDWVWLDSISLFQEKGLDQIMAELVQAKPHRKMYLPDKGEYGQNMNRLGLWVRALKRIPMNIGVTAHTLRTEDDDGRVLFMPAVQGRQMPEKICGHMNVVAYMFARRKDGKIQRGLRTTKDAKHYAKDRFGAIPGVMYDPTIPKIQAAVDKVLPAPTPAPRRRRSTK